MTEKILENITRIGNYALPTFGAFLTFSLSMGKLWQEGMYGFRLVIAFTMYTILSAFVAYFHRLKWLRHRNQQKLSGEKQSGLACCTVTFFMLLHLALIIGLGLIIWQFVWH